MLAVFARVSCRMKDIEEAVFVPDDRGRGLEANNWARTRSRAPPRRCAHLLDTAVADHETRWAEHDVSALVPPVPKEACALCTHFSAAPLSRPRPARMRRITSGSPNKGRQRVDIAGFEGRERQPVAPENQGSLSSEPGRRCLRVLPRARRCGAGYRHGWEAGAGPRARPCRPRLPRR
jgi:hypothetical protein